MSTKDLVLDTIKRMPNSATWVEIEERIRFLAAIEKGRKEIREGKVIPHQDVKHRLQSWISS